MPPRVARLGVEGEAARQRVEDEGRTEGGYE